MFSLLRISSLALLVVTSFGLPCAVLAQEASAIADSKSPAELRQLASLLSSKEQEALAPLIKKIESAEEEARSESASVTPIDKDRQNLPSIPKSKKSVEEVSFEYQPSDGLSELQSQLKRVQEALSDASTNRENAQTAANKASTRVLEIESALNILRSERKEIPNLADTKGLDGESDTHTLIKSHLIQARIRASKAKEQRLEAELKFAQKKLENENQALSNTTIEEQILKKEHDYLASLVENAEESIPVNALKSTESKLENAPEALSEPKSAALEARREAVSLMKKMIRLRRAAKNYSEANAYLDRRLERVSALINKGGRSEAIGVLLQNEKRRLPYYEDLGASLPPQDEELQEARLRLVQLQELEMELNAELEEALESRIASTIEINKVFFEYRASVEGLRKYYTDYVDLLDSVDTSRRDVIDKREEIRTFIDEHVLWIRSAATLTWADFGRALDAGNDFVAHEGWSIKAIGETTRTHPTLTALILLAYLLLFLALGKLKKRQDKIAEIVEKASAAPWSLTFQAWLILIARSLPWPALVYFVGWELSHLEDSSLAEQVSLAFYSAGFVLFLLIFERRLCRDGGVGEVHFDWNKASLQLFAKHLSWLGYILIPSVFLVRIFTHESVSVAHTNSLGRFVFIIQSLALAAFAHVSLRPSSPVMKELKSKYLGVIVERLGSLWYLTVVGVPMALAGIAIFGYFYAALEISFALLRTMIVLLAIMQVNALVSRYFFLYTRRMAIRRAKTRRRAQGLDQLSEEEIENDKLTAQDIKSLRNDSRSLRRIIFVLVFFGSVYLIWSKILPALSFFDDVEIYTYITAKETEATVVLGDLIGAIMTIIFMILALRTLPNLIEATILRRFHVDRGGRYATKAIARYVIIIVGSLMAFNRLGIAWGDVQWLVAGLSVGLGFGLQEIFANFISGLIMLFERPVRVGDTVTVANISGTVTRINMRATTVLDWERKELVVPNKMFVTDSLINWSLSDDVVRMTVEVGVAYGSDAELVEEILLSVGANEPLVVNEPSPQVFFRAFGDSTLNFELRVFVHGVEDWLKVKNAINKRIDRRFREAEIEIAFPQRVLHFAEEANTILVKSQEVKERAKQENDKKRDLSDQGSKKGSPEDAGINESENGDAGE